MTFLCVLLFLSSCPDGIPVVSLHSSAELRAHGFDPDQVWLQRDGRMAVAVPVLGAGPEWVMNEPDGGVRERDDHLELRLTMDDPEQPPCCGIASCMEEWDKRKESGELGRMGWVLVTIPDSTKPIWATVNLRRHDEPCRVP